MRRSILAENISQALLDEAFPDIWKAVKEDCKELSKKEIASRMFALGVHMGVENIAETMQTADDEHKDEKEEK